MKKDDFIATLAILSKEDIDKIIKEKGKSPKLIKPIIRYSKGGEKDAAK